jgi:hypothetical protein
MRGFWVVGLVAGLVAGCGDDAQEGHAEPADAGMDGVAATARDMKELEEIVAQGFHEFDRGNMVECTCLAEMGAYGSPEECFELLRSGPDWVSCASMAVADLNSPELRARGRCFAEQLKARNECYEATACDSPERTACDAIKLDCASYDISITVIISEQCPDTTILARLN